MKRQPLPVVKDCRDCGACCTGQEALPIHLANPSGTFAMEGCAPLPESLRLELLAAVERFDKDGWPAEGSPCIWYDAEAKRCKHYEFRPTLCRDEVKPDDAACHRWRRKVGIEPSRRYGLRNGRLAAR